MKAAKRPGLIAFLIGNPVSALAIIAGCCWYLYQWWHDTAPMILGIDYDWMALIALVMIFQAINAGNAVAEYWEWKRSWAALDGSTRPFATRHARWLFAVAVWAGATYYASQHPSDRTALIMSLPFAVGLPLLLFAAAMRRLARWLDEQWMRHQRKRPVRICLSRPRRAPTVAQAYAALPEHCRQLFAQPTAQPPKVQAKAAASSSTDE